MRHPDRARLNDHADGLLSAEKAAGVEEHLAVCADCRQVVEDVRALTADLAALPRDVPPPRDLRPPVPRRAPRRWLRIAAAVALLLGAGAVAVLVTGGPGAPGDRETPAVAMGPTADHAPIAVLEPYERASHALAEVFEGHRAQLDPVTEELVLRNLEALDAAIHELEQARAATPADPVLAELLQNRYRTRLDLLRDAVALLRT